MNALRCQAKRGVLTLRLCDEPAVATCSQCQRPTCPLHLADPVRSLCQACAVLAPTTPEGPDGPNKNKIIGPPATPDWNSDTYDDYRWAHAYRGWYYSSHSRPLAYNNDDLRSFNARNDGDILPEKDTSKSFLDS